MYAADPMISSFLTFPAFFTAWYHTIYASPWIFPPIAFSAFDVSRLFKYRVVVGAMKPVDEMMTSPGPARPSARALWGPCMGGAPAERAVRGARHDVLSHRQGSGCCARAAIGAVHVRVASEATVENEKEAGDEEEPIGEHAHMILDGPYGGCERDLGEYESVLLFAGGSGATFTLGLLDDLVGRCVRRGRAGGERAIAWFAPRLLQMAQMAQRSDSALELKIRIYVTRLCNTVAAVLNDIVFDSSSSSPEYRSSSDSAASSTEAVLLREKGVNSDAEGQRTRQGAGGIAVIASGPASLIREASNVVARANLVGRGGALAVALMDVCCLGLHLWNEVVRVLLILTNKRGALDRDRHG
ncbi:hypothetical protein B0H10DRAFT_1956791 [Mycena sp. CBHHK59/15]|nr:hypothetical protein B0H10DRAFT_1956791 [Mycena sp. CBHHK59/15]